jgi:F-type H+-transporting ATPase subunit b
MSGWTLAFQIANFLVLAAVLHRFLFKPVTAMIARRQDEMDAARKEAEGGSALRPSARSAHRAYARAWAAHPSHSPAAAVAPSREPIP